MAVVEIPSARFLPPVIPDDEYGQDDDVLMMRWESICPLAEWLNRIAA